MKYIEEILRRNEEVRSEKYRNWIISFMKNKNKLSDEDYFYDESSITKEDKEYILLLGNFQSYIEELANNQIVFPKKEDFYIYSFKLGNEYFEITTICGQGAITILTKVEFNEKDDYIYVDEEVPEETIKQRELVQYIIINKDLIEKISPAKFGVHIGHACTLCTVSESKTQKFEKWYQNGNMQKKIILKAPEKILEKLEDKFYCVRDLGYTEVKKDTLVAVSLGIMSRKDAKKYIKGLQAW